MTYEIEIWTIKELIERYTNNKIDLNPPYQRNDIWTNPSKRRLIDSIKKNYPLPLFFLYKKSDELLEMVDGQQRTRAIYGYTKGFFKDLNNISYQDSNQHSFQQYKLTMCIISEISDYILLSDFYYRVNKFGTKLNRPEILKAQFSETRFQDLISSLADLPDFEELNIFSDQTLDRMADIDIIGELLGLIEFGIKEKKNAADDLYKIDIDQDKSEALYLTFNEILSKIKHLNSIYPINKTRYKQRNDFYTLWNFLIENSSLEQNSIDYFYKILVLIGVDIYPTNEKCIPFKNYAYHCVTQSNSKNAREQRILFFKNLFLNTDREPNEVQQLILNFYELDITDTVNVQNYLTISGPKIQEKKGFPQLF